jgi:hypothetical protein
VNTLVNQGRVVFFIRLEPDRNTGIIASFTDAEKFTRRHGDLFQPCADLVVLGIVVQICDFKPGLRFIVPFPETDLFLFPLPVSCFPHLRAGLGGKRYELVVIVCKFHKNVAAVALSQSSIKPVKNLSDLQVAAIGSEAINTAGIIGRNDPLSVQVGVEGDRIHWSACRQGEGALPMIKIENWCHEQWIVVVDVVFHDGMRLSFHVKIQHHHCMIVGEFVRVDAGRMVV